MVCSQIDFELQCKVLFMLFHYKILSIKCSQYKVSVLKEHMDKMSEVLMLPWFQHKDFSDFRSCVEGFLGAIEQDYKFLKEQQTRNNEAHHKVHVDHIDEVDNKWTMRIVEGVDNRGGVALK